MVKADFSLVIIIQGVVKDCIQRRKTGTGGCQDDRKLFSTGIAIVAVASGRRDRAYGARHHTQLH